MTNRILPLLALLLACSALTAKAEQPAAPNIPAPLPNFAGREPVASPTAPSELPLPYAAWRGAAPLPPPGGVLSDAPLPLARPRSSPRRPFELGAALSAFLPSCGSGSLDDRGCATVSPSSGLDLALIYRAVPFFGVGGEAALSGFGGERAALLSQAGGSARFFGVVGRVYFADDGAWDPYLALTLGAGSLTRRARAHGTADAADEATNGFGARVAGGVDYLLGSRLRLGAGASFTRWLAFRESRCSGSVCADAPLIYGRLLGFATLGLRVTASFGDVL